MTTNRNAFRLVAGAGLVLAAVVVGVPLGAQAVAPAASPTASPFRTATSFPTVNPSVYPTMFGTAVAEMTRSAGTPQPPPMGPTQMAELHATQGVRIKTAIASTPQVTPLPFGSPGATPIPDSCLRPVPASTEWTTYTTKDGTVSFEYPTGWLVGDTESTSDRRLLTEVYNAPSDCVDLLGRLGLKAQPPRLWVKVSRRPNGLAPLKDFASWRTVHFPTGIPDPRIFIQTDTTVAGQAAAQRVSRTPNGGVVAITWFSKDSDLYGIEAYSLPENQLGIYDRIVRSLTVK